MELARETSCKDLSSLSKSHHSERRAISQAKGACHRAQQVSWGNVTLILDHDRFSQGYHNGRRYYFEDRSLEEQTTRPITVSSLLRLVAIPDEQGYYQLEDGRDMTTFQEGVEELVGVLIGYLGGPLYPETPEEQRGRRASCIVIHENIPVR